MQTSQHRVCYENHYQQMCAGISKCQLSSLNSLQLDPPHLMLPGSARKICIVLGHLKMHQTWPLHCLRPQRKWLSFPEHPSKQKICASGKKKWESLLIFLDVPHFCIISQNAQITSLFYPENGQQAPLPWIQALTRPTICTILMQKKKKKKWRGTVICFLVIVAHNVRELMCYI